MIQEPLHPQDYPTKNNALFATFLATKLRGPQLNQTPKCGLSLCPSVVLYHLSVSGNTYITVSSDIYKKTETCKYNFYDF